MRKVGPVGGPQKTYTAETLLTRGYGVKAGVAEGAVTAITGAGQRGVGIVDESVSTVGYEVSIIRQGDAVAIAGAAGTPGSYVKFDAVGRVIPVVGTAGGGEEVVGRLESVATALGDEVIVYVAPFIL